MNNGEKLDKIIDLQNKQAVDIAVIKNNTELLKESDEDKEKRIRSLEKEKWYQRGAIAALGGVFAWLFN